MIGSVFNEWQIISDAGRDAKSNRLVSAKCSCGLIKTQRFHTIKNGISTQCKSCSIKKRYYGQSLVGLKIGYRLVLSEANGKKKSRHYLCKCECGTETIIPGYRLKPEFQNKCPHCRVKTHGMSNTRTFKIWQDMLSRCNNPNTKAYKWYGARGIKVCESWLKFENFFKDMGIRPDKLQIDRINNNGNYEPGNCHWVTAQVNMKNTRSSRKAV